MENKKQSVDRKSLLKILVFSRYYRPAFLAGGPVVSIENLVKYLGKDFEFYIVTTDRDLEDVNSFPNIERGKWHLVGNAKVRYLFPDEQNFNIVKKIVKENGFKLIYLNSFWDPLFSIIPIICIRFFIKTDIKILLAPRGEFFSNALKIKKIKKTLFLYFGMVSRLYKNILWHATNQKEKEAIIKMFGQKSKTFLAPNLSVSEHLNNKGHIPREVGAPLRICFISRIVKMKNLKFVLQVLSLVDVPIYLDIGGPQEDKVYWQECQFLANSLPKNIKVSYIGKIRPSDVPNTLAKYDLFFLPTLGENYGHVIIESLNAGTPVLISDRTPWRKLEKIGVGWDIPLEEKEIFAGRLDFLFKELPKNALERREMAKAYAKELIYDSKKIDQNKAMFYLAFS
tara:strand:- start:219 stop:1409 length:1191 start_codon:yes stop_codon:yes gene_type:complete